jgi:hypothetical protein
LACTLAGARTVRFRPARPVLSYHDGGLLIGGGAYGVDGGRVVHRHASVKVHAPRAKDARSLAKSEAIYRRDHWGQSGAHASRRLPMADPRVPATRIAELVAVTYRTKKGSDTRLTDYRHPFRKPRPVLAWNSSGLLILGGVYHVTERGIID